MGLVHALNERAGCELELVGLIDQGQSGAAYVRWPDGRESVVTTAFAPIERMRQTAEVLAGVRSLGIPVPVHEFLLDLGDGRVAVVQERLPGSTVARADTGTVDAIIAVNDRFAGLLSRRPEVELASLSLGRPRDAVPYDLVEAHSPRARRVLAAIRRTAPCTAADIAGDDLVHTDLTVPNVLFSGNGMLTGVVDWNYGIARGDRHFGLVKLLHTLTFDAATAPTASRPSPAAIARVEQVLTDRLDPPTFRRYWAHQTLNMLHSSLRWGTEAAFRTHLHLGESKLS